jgi:lipoprotein NlpI
MGMTFPLPLLCLTLALAADAPLDTAQQYTARGMQRFQANDIAGSLRDFDRAAELEPRSAPHLWQRGISHYYAGRFEDGRRQFESHRAVNPHDVENATWHFICVAKSEDIAAARKAIIGIDTTRDTRVPLAEVYEFYAGRGSTEAILKAAAVADTPRAHMYAHLYLGLYYEASGDAKKAEHHIRQSAAAKLDGHYMHDVARVHARQRGWTK